VFAGPTGAGKSTLLNSVAGGDHAVAGPLRPTTKEPLVLASAARAHQYTTIGGAACHVVIGRAPILHELTLVDTPDIDSTSVRHRAIAETMIDNADVVVYVTSALRYADLVPWEVLRRAHSRGVPVVHVLNRIKRSSSGALADYGSRLEAEGLGSGVVPVHEHHLSRRAQSVPLMVIQELRDRLVNVVETRHAGSIDVVRSVLDTTLDQVRELVSAVDELAHDALEDTRRARAGLSVGLHRVRALFHGDNVAIGLQPLVRLTGRRLQTSGMVRRRAPRAASVALSHTLTDASLVGAVIADIRRQLLGDGLVRRGHLGEILAETHAAVTSAIAAWHRDLDELPMVVGSVDPALTSLLLARACIQDDAENAAVMRLLTRSREVTGTIADAGERLALHLMPVYTSVEYQVTSRISAVVSSDAAIYRARASLSAVIARSSFANA
jgi:hypothetical protein